GDDNRSRIEVSYGLLHVTRNETDKIGVVVEVVIGEGLAVTNIGSIRLCRGSDPGKHVHCLDREPSHCRFFGKHHAICAVEDSIGNIGGFSPGRAVMVHHRFQHLRGSNHRFTQTIARLISCFWTMAILSIGVSTPRSPRATMIPSAAIRISSTLSRAPALSILAMMNG